MTETIGPEGKSFDLVVPFFLLNAESPLGLCHHSGVLIVTPTPNKR